MRAVFEHEASAGTAGEVPARWPVASQLPHGGGYTVVVFLHSSCPCSRTTASELAALEMPSGTTIVTVFSHEVEPSGLAWDTVGKIPGAIRVVDDGVEAARFGAATSGRTVVYDGDGTLRFSGGITGSRGHAGDNVGRRMVHRIVAGELTSATHDVFGCAL